MKTLLFLATAVVSYAAGLNFPTVRGSVSPDLRWQVRCDTQKAGDGYHHAVLLSRFSSQKEVVVWRSGRSCDVLWSGDSQRLAITDWTGSNLSEIWLVDVSAPEARRLEIAGIEKLVQKSELEGHFYYEALRWESERCIAIRCFGHTGENPSHGFAYYFSVDIDSGVARLVKKENQEPNQALEPTPMSVTSPAAQEPRQP